MTDLILNIILISFASASISYTISKTYIFEKFRVWFGKKSAWKTKLINCPYCLLHWIILPINFCSELHWLEFQITESIIVDFVILYFATVSLAAIIIGHINRSFEFME